MKTEFGISSDTTITLGMTTYLLGLACGPMLMAPLSELYGRRIVYLVSMCLYFLFVIPSCVATNFYTILIVRFFGAVAGSVTISNAPGSLGDIFPEEYRPLAFSLFLYVFHLHSSARLLCAREYHWDGRVTDQLPVKVYVQPVETFPLASRC
jgi:MFS family permease